MMKRKIKRGQKKQKSGQWDDRIAVYVSKELRRKVKDMARLTGMTEAAYVRNLLMTKMDTVP